MKRLHQVILNILVTKDLFYKVFNYIYSWGETLTSISWEIRASDDRSIYGKPGKAVFGRDTKFNLTSLL